MRFHPKLCLLLTVVSLFFACSSEKKLKSGGTPSQNANIKDGADQFGSNAAFPAGGTTQGDLTTQTETDTSTSTSTDSDTATGSETETETETSTETYAEVDEALKPAPGEQECLGTSCKIFTTSARYSGNLGGAKGADKKCQDHAKLAKLPGYWAALLSTASMSAKDKIRFSGTVVNVKGETIGSVEQFFSGGRIERALNLDEKGKNIGGNRDVWTGTTGEGGIDAGHTCSSWSTSSSESRAQVGGSSETIGEHFDDYLEDCDEMNRLYCVNIEGSK